MTLPKTPDCAYWRKRTNPKWTTPQQLGCSDHPCSPSSHWQNYAFICKDHMETYVTPSFYQSIPVTHLKDITLFPSAFHAKDASLNPSSALNDN
eukprot:2587906-Ditylum_brightwellii.AAC.1